MDKRDFEFGSIVDDFEPLPGFFSQIISWTRRPPPKIKPRPEASPDAR